LYLNYTPTLNLKDILGGKIEIQSGNAFAVGGNLKGELFAGC
jgi:hypothetical protein